MYERVVLLWTVAFLVLALGHTEPSIGLLASVAALAITAILVVRATGALAPHAPLGVRAREHRQSLMGEPAPAHPSTPGRTQARAPGLSAAAA